MAIAAALIDAWGTRYNLNPDGISYVEMAQHAVANGRIELISGYWSPGYPILLLSVIRHISSDSPGFVPGLHIVNLALYLIGLPLFLWLVRRAWGQGGSAAGALPPGTQALAAVAYAVIALQGIDLWLLSPDVAVLLIVLLAARSVLGIERRDQSWRWALALGATLGAGYWMKGILLPLGALLVGILLLVPPRVERARVKVIVAGLVFLAISAPLVVMVSERVGHVTMGEVGHLNLAWQVDGVTPYVGWLGDSTGRNGRPVHPPRVLVRQPLTLEFATPLQATYPLWYDPSYWYAGVRTHIDVAGEWRAFRQSALDLGAMLADQWSLLVALALLFAATRRNGSTVPARTRTALLVWAALSTAVYASVHIESRYLAGFVAVALACALAALANRTPRPALRWALPFAALLMTASIAWHLAQGTGGFAPGYRPDYMQAADTLRRLGVGRNARVAVIGDGFEQYAAFSLHATIAAQVFDSSGYWSLTPDGRAAVRQQLAAIGVRALLANNLEPADTEEGWHLLVRADSSNIAMRLITPR